MAYSPLILLRAGRREAQEEKEVFFEEAAPAFQL
jgi:hypothetical protein